jgi:hypothetical protein
MARMKWRAFILTFALLVFCARSSHADEQLVVVDARGVGLRPGQMVDGAKPLTLREGQRVTLIAASGTTIKLRGPWDAPPGGYVEVKSAGLADAFRPLLTTWDSRTNEVATVRAGVGEAILPDPWLVDVARGGSRCVKDGEPVVFWREDATVSTLVISPADRSWSARANWPAEADRLVAPSSIRLRDGGTYLVSLQGAEAAITLNIVPASISTDRMLVAWLLEKGCSAQAAALMRTVQ